MVHSDKNEASKLDAFHFKSLVIAVLARGFLQNVMRSIVIVCKRVRDHQGAYMKAALVDRPNVA